MNEDLDLVYKRLFLKNGNPKHISAFVSGTEHIGTSWCALTLAHALNLEKERVLLVDGNGGLANISSYILLNNPLYLEEYAAHQKTINQLLTAYKNKDFNILTASPGNNFLENMPLGRIHIFAEDLAILAQDYQHTIIDVGANINDQTLGLCQIAEKILLMCSEKSSDLVKTFDTLRLFYQLNIHSRCFLIINRVNSFEDGYKIYKELYKAVERHNMEMPNLLGIVRFDTRIRDTIRNKELLLSRYPSSEAATDIRHIAQKLMEADN